MTRRGEHPLDPAVLRRFARLMQIHLLTNPDRVGRSHRVSGEYVRRQWRHLPIADMGALERVITQLVDGLDE